jgi:hypothetical protein
MGHVVLLQETNLCINVVGNTTRRRLNESSKDCPVYCDPQHNSCHAMSRRMQAFCAIKLPGPDKRTTCICNGEDNIKTVFKCVGCGDVGWIVKAPFCIERRNIVKWQWALCFNKMPEIC